ncbi:MAG: NAD(P)H-dependent flavin oxidoreductase [Bacillota bacterium]
MKLPELKIRHLIAPVPIVQGGMAVRISTAPLAAAVANEGGIGLIAGTGMSIEELKAEIRKARDLTRGIIGVNVLFAAREFASLVKAAIEEGIDLIVSGAGFSRDMFAWGKSSGIPIVPIVSSARLAVMAEKMGAAAVIVEGKEAGGHLGTERSIREILPEVKKAVHIPVIAAGGIVDGKDIVEAFRLGADGVQMGTRFAASVESNASDEFKQLYLKSQHEDVILVDSPVGLPGRGLKSTFTQKLAAEGGAPIEKCVNCLKKCSRRFCIMAALTEATRGGDFSKALVFSGEMVEKIKEILPVKEIFRRLLAEVAEIKEEVKT